MADPNPITKTWDRECVICGCKWLEADEGPLCPKCEGRKHAERTATSIPQHVFDAADAARTAYLRSVDCNDQIGALHAALLAAFAAAAGHTNAGEAGLSAQELGSDCIVLG